MRDEGTSPTTPSINEHKANPYNSSHPAPHLLLSHRVLACWPLEDGPRKSLPGDTKSCRNRY